MPNSNYKIIYSLKIHIELQRLGFQYITEMKNPKSPIYNCWVYEDTEKLQEALDHLLGGGRK